MFPARSIVPFLVVFAFACSEGGQPIGGSSPGPDAFVLPSDGGTQPPSITPAEICSRYLDCAAQVVPMSVPGLLATYGPAGTCWSSTQQVASTCITSCESGYDQLKKAYPAEPKCGGNPAKEFCKNTAVAGTCAQDFFYEISKCFAPTSPAQCTYGSDPATFPAQGDAHVCWASGETFWLGDSSTADVVPTTWMSGGSVCATGQKIYGTTRSLSITHNGQTLSYDWDTGKVICPDGSQKTFSSSQSTGCDDVDAIVGAAFPEWRENRCSFNPSCN